MKILQEYKISIESKYSSKFSSEESFQGDSDLALQRENAARSSRDLIYRFILNKKQSTTNFSEFLNDEIEKFYTAKMGEWISAAGGDKKTVYIMDVTSFLEIYNTYFEFLIKRFSDKLSSGQFFKFVEHYQNRKRRLLEPLMQVIQTNPFELAPRPESWHFYGELLKVADSQNLSPTQMDQLWNSYLKTDIQRLAIVAEHFDQYHRILRGNGNGNLANKIVYEKSREILKFNEIRNKIWNYSSTSH